MPYPPASEPLTKVTLNLYTKDVLNLQLRYGRGYQQKIREMVREKMIEEHWQFADLEAEDE